MFVLLSSGRPCGADERFNNETENDQAIVGAQRRFHGALGMGHESSDVAFAVADSGNIVNCAVGIAGAVVGTVGRRIAENHLAVFFELSDRGFVAIVITIGMRDGNLEDLALLRGVGERRVPLL